MICILGLSEWHRCATVVFQAEWKMTCKYFQKWRRAGVDILQGCQETLLYRRVWPFLFLLTLPVDELGAAEVEVHAAATVVAQPGAPSLADLQRADWILEGKTRFIQTCAYCHGTQGEAGKTRSFKTRKDWEPQLIHDTIARGRVNGPNVMPSWEGSISDEMIWKIVAYIKSLAIGDATESSQ